MTTETITIKGIEYEVIERETVEAIEQRHKNIAAMMRLSGTTARLVLKRPRGQKLFWANESRHGYSKPCAVPVF